MYLGVEDEYLNKRFNEYDQYIKEGKVPSSSKVIPVGEAVAVLPWVLPTHQALEIIRNARSFALADCFCRVRYNRCDHPREVCFLLNDFGDKLVAKGKARRVSLDEAAERLKLANQSGLVHMTLYNPEQWVFAVCSCCPCCCHDMQILKLLGRTDQVAQADYVARTDMEACSHCGACVERCYFGARLMEEGRMVYKPEVCYGCGLCVTVCPEGAIKLELRKKEEKAAG